MISSALPKAVEDELSRSTLRKEGPLLDVTIHAPGMEPVTGKALVDTGADRTAVEFSALEGLEPKHFYHAQGVTSEAITLPVYELELSFPGTKLPKVSIEDVAATPHLASQGLIALLGRDVLEHTRLVYDGPTGEFALATPRTAFKVKSPAVAVSVIVAFAALGAVAVYAFTRESGS